MAPIDTSGVVVPRALETRVSSKTSSTTPSSVPVYQSSERTFSVDEYLAILRQAEILSMTAVQREDARKTQVILDHLPVEEKIAHRVSVSSIYDAAKDLGVDKQYVDEVITKYCPSSEAVRAAMSSINVRPTLKQSREYGLERLTRYADVFSDAFTANVLDVKVFSSRISGMGLLPLFQYEGRKMNIRFATPTDSAAVLVNLKVDRWVSVMGDQYWNGVDVVQIRLNDVVSAPSAIVASDYAVAECKRIYKQYPLNSSGMQVNASSSFDPLIFSKP